MEIMININTPDRKVIPFKLNDVVFNYEYYRKIFSEQDCLNLIDMIKSKSRKKVAIIFGNCQTMHITSFLLNHVQFTREYFIIRIPAICSYIEKDYSVLKAEIEGGVFRLCDLFISQHISKSNKFSEFLSTQRLIQFLPESAKIIWIPNMYFQGYFPQYKRNEHNVDTDKHQSGRFPYGDKFIDDYMIKTERPDIDKIISDIKNVNFLSENKIKDNINDSLNELEKREWNCDIKILEVVEKNYQNIQLFFAPEHPVPMMILELTKRILDSIGMKCTFFINMPILVGGSITLRGQDIPIYPCIIKYFNFREYLTKFFANNCLWSFNGEFDKFVREYINWCWNEKL